MSQTYRIRVKNSLRENISLKRKFRKKISLLKILPMEDMGELMRQELVAVGWQEDQSEIEHVNGDWSLRFDPITQMLSISYETQELFEADFDGEVDVYSENDSKRMAQNQATSIAKGRLESEKNQRLEEMNNEFLKRKEEFLIELEGDLNLKIDQVLNKALRKKAASLGEVQSIEDTNGELVIRIKV